MAPAGRLCRTSALAVFVTLLAGGVSAQDRPLQAPTIAASTAAAADWVTTYYALKNFRLREVNPLLSPMQRDPGRMISVGAAMDAGLVSAWNLGVGGNHPKIAATGLWAMTAFRAYLAIHNLRNTRRAARRVTPAGPASLDAAVMCAAPGSVPPCVAAARTAR